MTSSISLLDRYYGIAKNQLDGWGFYRSLADYIQFIEDTPEIEKIADKYNVQSNNDHKKFVELEEKVLQETIQAKKKLNELLESKLISYDKLHTLLKEYDNWLDRKSSSSNSHTDNVFGALCDIVRSLLEHGHIDILKDFITTFPHQDKDLIEKFIFAPSLDELEAERYYLKEKEASELWSDWQKLSLVYFVIVKGMDHWQGLRNEIRNKTSQNGKAQLEMLGFATLKGEMNRIRDGSKETTYIFIRTEYERVLDRIHIDLIKQLSNVLAQKSTQIKPAGQKVSGITFIKKPTPQGPAYSFYINNEIVDVRNLRRDSSRIRKFIEFVDHKDLPFNKDLLDYINSNKDCALYCAGKYSLAKILERHGNSFRVSSSIKVRIISEKAYKAKLNKIEVA